MPNSGEQPTGSESMSKPISLKEMSNQSHSSDADPAKPGTDEGTKPSAPSPEKAPETKKPSEPKAEEVDYQTKFSESSREAQRLHKLLIENGFDPKTGKRAETPAPQPTEQPAAQRGTDEPKETAPQISDKTLEKLVPGFENLPEEEKNTIRDIKNYAKKISQVEKLVAEMNDERMYVKDFNKLVREEKWKKLRDFDEEFKAYAYQPENLNASLETLAASFLFSKGQESQPADEEDEEPAPEGVEPGTHGPRGGEPSEDGLSDEESASLRKTNPREYARLIKARKLKIRERS